ncbi:MAG: tail fiber domain-containing protein [Acidobacteria bacterium]|nr:tail fiber domain-containing protein [Acidobacteriota bacterium]
MSGLFNSYFGFEAGFSATGDENSFFGNYAGTGTTTGERNSFFGALAGVANKTGFWNSYFGAGAGLNNTTGYANSFFGVGAGQNNRGSLNTSIGAYSNVIGDLGYATAIGAGARVFDSNTIALGRDDASDTVLVYGPLKLNTIGFAGTTQLCLNAGGFVAACSSSLRYKTNVQNFNGGLDLLRRFRPVAFDWKEDGTRDVGFIAEEVNEIEPRLTISRNGRIEGVKYAQITTVLVNSVKEQQEQIDAQQKIIIEQQRQIEALKRLVCQNNKDAEICKEKE